MQGMFNKILKIKKMIQTYADFLDILDTKSPKKCLPVGELNPGLPRDRRGYLPLY